MQPKVTVVEPGPRHAEILERLVMENQATGPLLTDAVLAALAVEHGGTLAYTDRGFARFGGTALGQATRSRLTSRAGSGCFSGSRWRGMNRAFAIAVGITALAITVATRYE